MFVSNGTPSFDTPSKISKGKASLGKILGGASVSITENKSKLVEADVAADVDISVDCELDTETETDVVESAATDDESWLDEENNEDDEAIEVFEEPVEIALETFKEVVKEEESELNNEVEFKELTIPDVEPTEEVELK